MREIQTKQTYQIKWERKKTFVDVTKAKKERKKVRGTVNKLRPLNIEYTKKKNKTRAKHKINAYKRQTFNH